MKGIYKNRVNIIKKYIFFRSYSSYIIFYKCVLIANNTLKSGIYDESISTNLSF